MTNLNLTLTKDMVDTVTSTNGGGMVNAYAMYFNGSDRTLTSLSENSVLKIDQAADGSASTSIALPDMNGGKVYFVIQSLASGDNGDDAKTILTQESMINTENAQTYDFRYDSFEVTLSGGAEDQGNLTSVNGFGIPMEVSVAYDDGTTATRGYGITGSDMFDKIQAIDSGNTLLDETYDAGPLTGDSRYGISPSSALTSTTGSVDNSPYQFSDWTDYITSLSSSDDITVAGFFNGATDANGVYHDPGFFSYEMSVEGNDIWLSPTATSEIEKYIKFTNGASSDAAQNPLAQSIYSTLGSVDIYTEKTDTTPYLSDMNTGWNNQWGNVLTQFFTGFTAGYYDTQGDPVNGQIAGTINLNQNWNWDPSYAFGHNLSGSLPASHFMDAYSQVFFENSNSYGSGYSDNLMTHYDDGGPLISVSNPVAGNNVANIDLTLFADTETPTGYETPAIYNTIDPGSAGYAAIATTPSSSHGANITLNFANQNMVLDGQTDLSLEIYTGGDVTSESSWQTVDLDPASGADLWQNWTVAANSAQNGFTASASAAGQPEGSMLITLPSATSGVSWYKLNVGSGEDAKTFNLYTTNTSDGFFVNPDYTGNDDPGALAIDGLATISTPNPASPAATINTFSVNFMYSSTTTVDPDLMTQKSGAAMDLPGDLWI